MIAAFEHVNVTVPDPMATATLYGRLFGWHIRWQGPAKDGGTTVHVGTKDQYVALYSGRAGKDLAPRADSYEMAGGLNHIAVVVSDLPAAEAAVRAAGLTPHSHADYEPGRRFYFHDGDGIEYEVVSYA